ncbi:MAG TPA: hypothetical protein V6C65_06690 [Allocoleopsis sp.]
MANPVIVPVYEYYAANATGYRYQYSTSPDIRDGWVRKGIAFYAFAQSQAGTKAVEQYYAPEPWRYQYVIDKSKVGSGWYSEGIAFYAFTQPPQGVATIPVYQYSAQQPYWRFRYSINGGIQEPGWRNDGPVFYVFAATSV